MISVAMATYNGEQYITEQLQSICNQTQKVDEIVITDDCSTDRTVVMIRKFAEEHSGCPIRLYENEINLGYKRNFRKAVSLCEGDVVFLSDQDDVWKPEKVEVMYKVLQKDSKVSLLSSSFEQIDGDGNVIAENKNLYKKGLKNDKMVPVPLEDLIFHNISQGCAMAFKTDVKDLFLEHFTEELPHDWILNVVAAMQKKCYFIKRTLFCYRVHGSNTTGVNDNLTLQHKKMLKTRAFDARQAIRVIAMIKEIDSKFYTEHPMLAKAEEFAIKHIEYLQNGNIKGIICQNFNSNYKRLKTFRGRLLDIYFVMKTNKVQGGPR